MYALVWKVGPYGEQRVELSPGQSVTIGRDEACDATIDDEAASRRHARVLVSDDKIEVQDLASRNGTWLGGKRITKAVWKPGTPLKVGDSELSLQPSGDLSSQSTVVVSKGSAAAGGTTQPAGNFITKHWRGGYSLGWSIFMNTLLLSFVLGVIIANLTEEVAADSSPRARIAFVTVTFLTSLSVLIWQVVGDWRSLWGAKARGAGRFARWSAAVFIALLTLGIPFTVYEYTETRKALKDIETGRDLADGPAYTLTKEDNVLVFNGIVAWPLVADVRQQLADNPDINVVLLNSPGGDTIAGRRVNDILREHQVATAVLGTCASACTVMYAAGQRRAVGPQGQLGFHASALILMDPMMTRIMNSLTFRSDRLNAQYYRQAGIDDAFIERAISTPSTDLWVPPHDVLLQANVIHEVLPP